MFSLFCLVSQTPTLLSSGLNSNRSWRKSRRASNPKEDDFWFSHTMDFELRPDRRHPCIAHRTQRREETQDSPDPTDKPESLQKSRLSVCGLVVVARRPARHDTHLSPALHDHLASVVATPMHGENFFVFFQTRFQTDQNRYYQCG